MRCSHLPIYRTDKSVLFVVWTTRKGSAPLCEMWNYCGSNKSAAACTWSVVSVFVRFVHACVRACVCVCVCVQRSLEWQEVDRKLLKMTDDVDYDVECK